MATVPNHVQPGDPIASAIFNSIIDALADHESRLAKLEGSSSVSTGNNVAITGLAPAGNLQIGGQVTIFGRNFGFSTGAQSVWFNNSRVTVFDTASNDSKLIINQIPNVPGVQNSGTQVTLTVANLSTSDSRTVTLQPAQTQQQGNITLSFQGVSPTTIIPNSTPTFTYNLSSPALLPTIVTITPTISIPGVSLQVLPSNQITLTPNQTTQISVNAGQIPGGVTSFTLTVNATASGTTGSTDGPRSFSIGAPAAQPDPELSLSVSLSNPASALSGTTLTVKAGTTATLQLRAQFTGTDQRSYNLSASVASPAAGWTAVLSTAPGFETHTPYTIAGSAVEFPAIDVTPSQGATSPATLQVALQRVGSNFVNTATCILVAS